MFGCSGTRPMGGRRCLSRRRGHGVFLLDVREGWGIAGFSSCFSCRRALALFRAGQTRQCAPAFLADAGWTAETERGSHLDWFAMQCDHGPRAGQVVQSLLRTIRSTNYSYVLSYGVRIANPAIDHGKVAARPQSMPRCKSGWAWHHRSPIPGACQPGGVSCKVLVAARRCDSRDCRGPVLPRGSLVAPLIHAVAVFGTTRLVADLRLLPDNLATNRRCAVAFELQPVYEYVLEASLMNQASSSVQEVTPGHGRHGRHQARTIAQHETRGKVTRERHKPRTRGTRPAFINSCVSHSSRWPCHWRRQLYSRWPRSCS